MYVPWMARFRRLHVWAGGPQAGGAPLRNSVPDAPLLDQLVGVEVRRAYPAQQALLGGDASLRCRRQLARDLAWDEQNAVLVGVNQVARADQKPAHCHRLAGRLHPYVSVRDARTAGEEVEAHRARLFQVADAAVGDAPGTAKRSEDGGVHLAPQRPVARRLV